MVAGSICSVVALFASAREADKNFAWRDSRRAGCRTPGSLATIRL
jgi:hypothetical protein